MIRISEQREIVNSAAQKFGSIAGCKNHRDFSWARCRKQTLISAEHNAMRLDNLMKLASTLIPVPRLARDNMLFEIDAIAASSE